MTLALSAGPKAMHKDFFDYFPAADRHRHWGIYATSFGHVHVPAGGSYPPSSDHPKSHSLGWEKGRILHEYQVLYLSAGRGFFESTVSPLAPVEAGTLLVLFPGVWHRYRPDPAVGWTEHWIELGGSQIDELRRLRIIEPGQTPAQLGQEPEIIAAFTAAEALARGKPPGFQVRLGLLGLQILTQLAWPSSGTGSPPQRMDRVVREAVNLLASNLDQPLSPEWIARDLHVGYSYFRRAFKAQTGFSPKRYRLEIRFRRSCDFLRHSDLTVKEIAQKLGYDSPYHLSTDFKNRTRKSPTAWRRSLVQASAAAPPVAAAASRDRVGRRAKN